MPAITLPSGEVRQYPEPVSPAQVAGELPSKVRKSSVAARVDGRLQDLSDVIERDAALELVGAKEADGEAVIRHSCAHLLGHALKQLRPQAKLAIGPVVEHGFYYDIDAPEHLTEGDLEALEARMRELAATGYPVDKRWYDWADAHAVFSERGEPYKLEILERDIPRDQPVGLYHHQEYIDMCRGPHVPHMGFCRHFKLLRISGAYWRGDSKGPALQRIYGTAWAEAKGLRDHLTFLEEAERRDHRRLARQMNLFHMQEEAPGSVFWHPHGWTLYRQIERYIREAQTERGYEEVRTPQVVDYSLWERSGHAEQFAEDMFAIQTEGRQYALKPMNCPCHVQIFNHELKSHRDLPIRLCEFGACHRNELSGALHGLMRVRGFVQDDGHIFCTEEQLQDEVTRFIDFLHQVYRDFGFTEVRYHLSTRPDSRVGEDADWDRAEAALAEALNAQGLDWGEKPGEGAFYGPKIEFSLQDSLGRVWQCGTMQVDFSMPGRLGASYVAADGGRRTPVMLHRAILGSFERFIGILIEHHAGRLPLWLAPVQAMVLTITEAQNDYAESLAEHLRTEHFRVETDLRNEKIGYKIRQHTLSKVPYLLIVGAREAESGQLALRASDRPESEILDWAALTARLNDESAGRGLTAAPESPSLLAEEH